MRTKTILVIAALMFVALRAFCSPEGAQQPQPPQQTTDEQLLKRLNAKAVDDYDRELFGPEQRKGGVPAKPAEGGKIDDRSLRRELGKAAVAEDENPLLGIARQMRTVQDRMAHSDAGPATQTAQQRIVGDIDRLIEQARKSCQKSASQCNSQQAAAPRATEQPKLGNNKSNGPSKPGTKPSTKPATEANDPHNTNKQRHMDPAEASALVKKTWGELRARDREQMLQLPMEEFLPKYRTMIEDYFRRLAQPADEEGFPPRETPGSTEPNR